MNGRFFGTDAFLPVRQPVERHGRTRGLRHPNDIHDHVQLRPSGIGGLPHVSSYIRKARADTENVLVLDAGDVSEERTAIAFPDPPSAEVERLAASDVAPGDDADLLMRTHLLL